MELEMQVWFRNLQISAAAEGEERGAPLPCSSGDFKKRKGGETGGRVLKIEASNSRIKAI